MISVARFTSPSRDAVLLPVYNEERTVDSVIDAVRVHFNGDIIVVDDGSSDATAEILAGRRDIFVVTHPRNLGYGRAIAEGFKLARARAVDRVVTMDCDGQHEPAHIPDFLAALDGGDDIISGSRYLPESAVVGLAPPERREVNARVTAEINRVTGWNLTDAFCGFKAYSRSVFAALAFTEPGYAFPLEVWAKAYIGGLAVSERPVARIYCDYNRSFGGSLDDAKTRLAYYMRVWRRGLSEGMKGRGMGDG